MGAAGSTPADHVTGIANSRPRTWTKKALKIAAGAAVLYLVVSGVLFVAMLQPPEKFAKTVSHVPWPAFAVLPFEPLWNAARKGQLHVGDMAPDFDLETVDHQGRFALASARGKKPVVLVFGSYT